MALLLEVNNLHLFQPTQLNPNPITIQFEKQIINHPQTTPSHPNLSATNAPTITLDFTYKPNLTQAQSNLT